ncbi:MAG: hypothetical protein VX130_04895 [Verrucomicrobiota bacterium]|nr:hypothetical protein [Verrucomicrobiota bacterium]
MTIAVLQKVMGLVRLPYKKMNQPEERHGEIQNRIKALKQRAKKAKWKNLLVGDPVSQPYLFFSSNYL